RSCRTGCRNDAALGDQPGDRSAIDAPQRITRRNDIECRRHWTALVRTQNEPQRSVELADIVEKDMKVERQRLGDAIFGVMRGKIIMPLPDLAFEGGLGIDLDLLDVELVA